MITFSDFALKSEILKALDAIGFESPTEIQAKTIPALLDDDRDIVGFAQTGTGKTAAFGIPILNTVDTSSKTPQALILSPTRELCVQIAEDLKKFSKFQQGVKVATVYGGSNIMTQIRALKS